MPFLPPPNYSTSHVSQLFPSALAALGVKGMTNELNIPLTSHVIVLIVDGLGSHQLSNLKAHTPFLRTKKLSSIRSTVPSTTACSLSSIGTALPPGKHGIIGYDVLEPEQRIIVNMLGTWEPHLVASQWQPYLTMFTQAVAEGISVFSVGLEKYKTSSLTQAVLSGSEYISAHTLEELCTQSYKTTLKKGPSLCYAYWNKLDHIAHGQGWNSSQYASTLEELDYQLQRLSRQLPSDALLVLSSDHGMIDVPSEHHIDLAMYPELMEKVWITAGEPRFLYLYCEQDQAASLARAFQETFRSTCEVKLRDDMIAQGFFGPVDKQVYSRLGNVIVSACDDYAFFDTQRVGLRPLSMVGQHGSLTAEEQNVPLVLI